MKLDIADVNSRAHRHTERLDGAIQVHVKDCVFIVPHAATQVGDFVTNEKDTIVARIRLGTGSPWRLSKPGWQAPFAP